MITIILFYFYGKMFISMNLWMIGKNSMKTSYQKNKTFIDTLVWKILLITNADYMHAKRFYKDFEIKNLRKYHDLYVQSDTLLLVDVFENFRNMCIEIYDLGPAKKVSASRLA